MKALSTAIYGKLSGSALASHIGTRLYKGRAPEGATYPYVVYLIVSNSPDYVFARKYEDTLIQFSAFSIASGSTEIEDIYIDLKALYDECSMTITGDTLIWMRWQNAIQQIEDHTTPNGTAQAWAYHVDFMVTVKD